MSYPMLHGVKLLRRRGGSTTVVTVIFLCAILSAMTLAYFIGRAAYRHHELQTAADAVVQAAALVVQHDGVGAASRPNAFAGAWEGNVTSPLAAAPQIDMQYDRHRRLLHISTTMSTAVQHRTVGLGGPGSELVRASSQSRVAQDEISDVTRDRAKVVLVLDYSGSMDATDFGGGMSRINGLRLVVNDLLDLGLDVQWGLVLYSDNTFDTTPVRDGNAGTIRVALQEDTRNMTCTSCGLNSAGALLRATDEKLRHVILVSDGIPNNGGGEGGAYSAADRLRVNDKTTVFAIGVGPGGSLNNVMRRIAGDRGDPNGNDAGFAYAATNRQVMQAAFMDIIARILCQVTPQTQPRRQADGTYRIFGFLRNNAGVETPVHDAHGVANPRALLYDPDSGLVSLPYTPDCEKMLDRTHMLVLRYDWPVLAE